MMPSSTDYYDAKLGVVRIAACLVIVLLHTLYSSMVLFADRAGSMQLMVSSVVTNELMWAVPAFLMVSGILLLDRCRTITLRRAWKYIRRVLLALIVCSLGFRIFDIVMNQEPMSVSVFLVVLQQFLTAGGWSPLWYLYLMSGLYLMLPFYHMVSERSSETELWLLLTILFIFCSIVPLIKAFGLNLGFYIPTSIIYPFYLFLGHAIWTYKKKWYCSCGIVMVLVSSIVIALLTIQTFGMQMSDTVTAILKQMNGYASLLVILQASGLFLFIASLRKNTVVRSEGEKQTKEHRGETIESSVERCSDDAHSVDTASSKRHRLWGHGQQWIRTLDACTFGIYLLHMVFIRLILRYHDWNPYAASVPVLAFAGFVLGIFLLSFVIILILKKLPIFKSFL